MTDLDPMNRLKETLLDSQRPMLAAMSGLSGPLREIAAALKDLLAVARDGKLVLPAQVEQPALVAPAAIAYDMETAIKAAGAWECEGAYAPGVVPTRQIRCVDCPTAINLECLQTYSLQGTAERAIGKSSGDDDEVRFALHAVLRGAGAPHIAGVHHIAVQPSPLIPVTRLVARAADPAAEQAPRKPRKPVSDEVRARQIAGLTKAREAKAQRLREAAGAPLAVATPPAPPAPAAVVAAPAPALARPRAAPLRVSIGTRVAVKAKGKSKKPAPAKKKKR